MKSVESRQDKIGIAEQARLAMLADYDLDVTHNENEFDHIVRLASRMFDARISLITIVERKHQYYKARVGTDAQRNPRQNTFCNHVVESGHMLVIEDMAGDPRFAANRQMKAEPLLRFYAGAPLVAEGGHVLGTLCILDHDPRTFDEEDRKLLRDLAKIVSDRMELRRSERKRGANERRLTELAHFDPLTGLANRGHFRARAAELLRDANGQAREATLILVDVDAFRNTNGILGEEAGDEILRTLARRIEDPDNGCLYARVGDDEFAVFIPGIGDPLLIQKHTHEFHQRLQRGMRIGDHTVSVEVSYGYALAPLHGSDIDTLMANAQLALREAKHDGGGGIQIFQRQFRMAVEQEQELQIELRRAASEGEFELYYQPQIDIESDRIIGAEALLRWNHPEHGVLLPGQFLSTLEAMPLSLDVGDDSLRAAFAQADAWRHQGTPIRVSVNLFASQFLSQRLLRTIAEQLRRRRLPPELIEIELTETVAIDSGRRVIGTLERLADMGISIALDDFGTGYASLTALKSIPAHRLKIDRQFVTGARLNDEDAAVVEAVILFGERLGCAVTAEGVETEEEEAWLRNAGCREMQGYRYGKPMPAHAFTAMLAGYRPPLKLAL